MNGTTSAAGGLLSKHLLRQYKIGYLHMRAFASDFSDAEARKAPPGHLPLVWYIAHLMCAHDHFLKLYVGPDGGLTDSFVQRYAGPCSECADFSDAPPIGELVEKYEAMHMRTRSFLEGLEEADFERTAEGAAHPTFRTLGGALTVVGFHDGYHAGQLADLRRAMGKTDLAEEVSLLEIA